jgi:proline racemase
MKMHSYLDNKKELNLLAPQDIVATATPSAYVNVSNAAGTIEFQIPFGAIASTDATGEVAVTIEASTAGSSNATETAIAFRYRLSGAVATDSMGALTSATATGAAISEASDNKTLFLFVEPSQLAAVGADFKFLRVVIAPTAETTSTIVGGVHCSFVPRYAQATQPSST